MIMWPSDAKNGWMNTHIKISNTYQINKLNKIVVMKSDREKTYFTYF